MIPDNLHNLIENIVEQALDEVAKSESDAMGQNLALYISREDNSCQLVLYNPSLMDKPQSAMVGFIKVNYKSLCDNWLVKYSAAIKGYGPLMYELAMSLIHPDFLRADNGAVSPQAQKVWSVFFGERNEEFNTQRIDNQPKGNHNCLPALGAKEKALNYSFSVKSPISYSNLEQIHDQFVYNMESAERQEFEDRLLALGQGFFWRMYK